VSLSSKKAKDAVVRIEIANRFAAAIFPLLSFMKFAEADEVMPEIVRFSTISQELRDHETVNRG